MGQLGSGSPAAATTATTTKRSARRKSTATSPPHSEDQRRSRIPVVKRTPVVPYPLSPDKPVPQHIPQPPYAQSGIVPNPPDEILLHGVESIDKMRDAARLARRCLDLACELAVNAHQTNLTTDDIDTEVHNAIIEAGAYPSPLRYAGFPKSMCSSVNEVICHGIPDMRPLQFGDAVSFDVSCFLNGVHGDNCATVIVGDCPDDNDVERDIHTDDFSNSLNGTSTNNKSTESNCDWRGVPYRTEFATEACQEHFEQARRLVKVARQCLYAAIDTVEPGSCLTQVGKACEDVASQHGYQSVRKYRGHGISSDFHTPPFVKHYRNLDFLLLRPGMIFTIEPMIVVENEACFEWEHDQWTVATIDGSLAAQFEHTVLVTETGVEILTLPE